MATSDRRSIPWKIEPQTKVKHELLQTYIAPWMKILWQQQEVIRKPSHLIFVDGFSGPGEYLTDEAAGPRVDGSPILVGKIANELLSSHRKLDIFAFDTDAETIAHLTPLLQAINHHGQRWTTIKKDFLSGATDLLSELSDRLGQNIPAFFFIDPFGYSGFPMSLLSRILKNERTEVFITLMTYDIVRFIENPECESKMHELFGTDAFKKISSCRTPEGRVNFVTSLYRNQLKSLGGAKYVTGFRVNTPDQAQRARYFLIHGSNHIKALKVMKNAMEQTSGRDFRFEAIGLSAGEELDLFEPSPQAKIKSDILDFIRRANAPVSYDSIEEWAYEATAGTAKHIKGFLRELEIEGSVRINRLKRQQTTTVSSGATVQFERNLFNGL